MASTKMTIWSRRWFASCSMKGKVGESADAVWANLAHERAQMFAQAPVLVDADEGQPAR